MELWLEERRERQVWEVNRKVCGRKSGETAEQSKKKEKNTLSNFYT